MDIESVTEKDNHKPLDIFHEAECSACEMAVTWMRNQLLQNQTEEHILNYASEVRRTRNLFDILATLLLVDYYLCLFYSFVIECQIRWDSQL